MQTCRVKKFLVAIKWTPPLIAQQEQKIAHLREKNQRNSIVIIFFHADSCLA